MEDYYSMTSRRLFNITLSIMALLTLLIVNPAFAEAGKEGATPSNETLASMEKININQADAKALTTLKGVGKDRAVKIIEYREKNGPFEKVEDIMKVKGIGKKIFEQNKNVLSV
jgi:competence protein ComEA